MASSYETQRQLSTDELQCEVVLEFLMLRKEMLVAYSAVLSHDSFRVIEKSYENPQKVNL
jgi:hypothetical protein